MFSTQQSYNDYLNNSLKVLENKNCNFLVDGDTSIKKVGFLKKIIEILREIFGAVNRTSSEALEFQVIRFVTCGVQNQWINESNITQIQALALSIINKQVNHQHHTLNALILNLENMRKKIDLTIDFNEFNKIYFESHKAKLTKKPFNVILANIFGRLIVCFNAKNRLERLNLKLQKEKFSIASLNEKIETEIRKMFPKIENIVEVKEQQIVDAKDQKKEKEIAATDEFQQENDKQEKPALFTFADRVLVSRERSDVAVFDEGIASAISEEKNAADAPLVGDRKLTEKVNKAEKPTLALSPNTEIAVQKQESSSPTPVINSPQVIPQKIILAEPVKTIKDASTGVIFPEKISFEKDGKHFQLQATGVATRKKLIVKIYSVASYLQEGISCGADKFEVFKQDEVAKQMTIKWVYEAPATKVQDGCRESLRKALSKDEYNRLQKEINTCLSFFNKDTKKDDEHIVRWLPGGYIEVLINNQPIGSLVNTEFANKLWNMWMGPNSVVDRNKLVSLSKP